MNSLRKPKLSVIIPVYNDPKGLKDTLSSLTTQDYSHEDFEIIVCDNGSTDNTLDIARYYIKKYPELIRIEIEDKIQSSYAARNRGIKVAKGEVIAFIDADMTVGKGWVRKILSVLSGNDRIYYAGCRIQVDSYDKNIFGFYSKITSFPIESYLKNNNFAPTACLVVRSEVFQRVGIFDERLISGGDFEFGNRAHKKGIRLYYLPEIKMKHPARACLSKILSKSFRIGRGYKQLYYYYPGYKESIFNNFNVFKKITKLRNKINGKNNKIISIEIPKWMKFIFYNIEILKKFIFYFGYYFESIKKH